MLPIIRPSILNNCDHLTLDMIYDTNILNIFSDASMLKREKRGNNLAACYGAVAVYNDTILEEFYRVNSLCTVPAAELRGIRCSLHLALKYRHMFPVINLFSDSLYSVQAIRDYCYDWVWDEKNQYYKYNKRHTRPTRPIENQNLIYECISLIRELQKTNIVNIFHQKGHIQNPNGLIPAIEAFKLYNGMFDGSKVSYNIIRYISTYNNYVDNCTRSIIHRTNVFDNNYCDPVIFKPTPNVYVK